ncbi:uncharacterized protein LY89DRAFT_730700 [Mollisia scopiformis]|uniref:Uncharacterized protein n=1 Tax=Mollisia scopiformis TaxID=149040 RepID=A0A194XKE2_MOLSC|nr:uncharacterized protein LY89DRAFT_730700 [Mollisia scopiformis]KUJ20680.1 hypothetical protein LY89DRAFT_730700 [Mollisia scopiformis]
MASKDPGAKTSSLRSTAVDPIATPTYPTGVLFTVLTTTTIRAPLSSVLELSLETSSWPTWNPFVPRANIISQPATSSSSSTKLEVGTKATFHSRMKRDGPPSSAYSDHEVVSIDRYEKEGAQGWSIVWKTIGIPGGDWILRTERVQEMIERKEEDGSTVVEYKTWGTFGGPMAYMLSFSGTKNDIVDRFEDWARGLKEHAEHKGHQ